MTPFSIQNRLASLLLVVTIALAAGLAGIRSAQTRQASLLFEGDLARTDRALGSLLQLRSRSYRLHVDDYSMWDQFRDMCVRPNLEWAQTHLGDGTSRFSFDALWALDRELRTIYSARHDGGPSMDCPPVPAASLRAALAKDPFRHFYTRTPQGLMEIWTAPVQPSNDVERRSPPAGYYVIARYWTPGVLAELSAQAGGRAALLPAGRDGSGRKSSLSSGLLVVQRVLPGLDGSVVAVLELSRVDPLYANLETASNQMFVSLAVGALAVLLGTYLILVYSIGRPLQRIAAGLEQDSLEGFTVLETRRDEVGRIARLARDFFDQRARLMQEALTRRRAEQDVAAQEVLLRTVIDSDPNMIYVVDQDRRVVLANTRAMTILSNAPRVDSTGDIHAMLNALGCGASYRRASAAALATSEPHVCHETLRLADGSLRHYRAIRCPLLRPDGKTHLLTVSIDITEHVEQEAVLREAKEAAEAGTRAKSMFLANISHELRTPMHGILSYAKFGMRECQSPDRAELLDYFKNINECGSGLLELVNDLLDLAKLESGKMALDFDGIEIADLVDQVVAEFDPVLQEQSVTISALVRADLPSVPGDRKRLLQVLRNFVANAARHSSVGSEVTLTAESDGELVHVSVEDRGPGIPPGELESIFDQFIQSSRNRTSGTGTGLGLSICREIIHAHGGRIWAENRDGGGARFTFELTKDCAAARPAA